MKTVKSTIKKGAGQALAGLFFQILIVVLIVVIEIIWKKQILRHVLWHALAPIGVWFYLILFTLRNNDNAYCLGKVNWYEKVTSFLDNSAARYGAVAANFISAIFLMQSAIAAIFTSRIAGGIITPVVPVHLPLVLYSVLTFVTAMISIYYVKLSGYESWKNFRAAAHYCVSLTICLSFLLINSILEYFSVFSFSVYLNYILITINTVLAIEFTFLFVMSFFRPKQKDIVLYPFYLSYILEIVLHPKQIGLTTRLMLQNILGYDINAHSFYSYIKTFFLPLVLFSAIFLFCLSSFVIIRPGEEAIFLRFGKAEMTPRKSGLHLKPPYPFGKIRRYDVNLIQRIHVGSHKPSFKDGTVFKDGVPLLWTTDHGLQTDELLILASPRHLMQNAAESGGKIEMSSNQTPSVSLAGADIVIEYMIGDLINYTMSSVNPEKILFVVSESVVSKHLLAYDIDTLLSDGRIGMAKECKGLIQEQCNKNHLGITILNVGITAVHPPTEIADVFEENVSAVQERETKIQLAQQQALRVQVETAGSIDAFKKLADQINREEMDRNYDHPESEWLILQCGGEVSKLVSEATGYRWSRENIEGGKAEKFTEELNLYKTSKMVYRYDRYMSVLEDALSDKMKIVVSRRHKDLLIDIGGGPQSGRITRNVQPSF